MNLPRASRALALTLVFVFEAGVAMASGAGQLNPTFGNDGKAQFRFGNDQDFDHAMVRQPDGKIVVAGSTVITTTGRYVPARYQPDGSLALRLDGDGLLPLPAVSVHAVSSVMALPDGKAVLMGSGGPPWDPFEFAVPGQHFAAGDCELAWDGRDGSANRVADGTCLLRARSGNLVATERVTVV